jgi:hypothetical protein
MHFNWNIYVSELETKAFDFSTYNLLSNSWGSSYLLAVLPHNVCNRETFDKSALPGSTRCYIICKEVEKSFGNSAFVGNLLSWRQNHLATVLTSNGSVKLDLMGRKWIEHHQLWKKRFTNRIGLTHSMDRFKLKFIKIYSHCMVM